MTTSDDDDDDDHDANNDDIHDLDRLDKTDANDDDDSRKLLIVTLSLCGRRVCSTISGFDRTKVKWTMVPGRPLMRIDDVLPGVSTERTNDAWPSESTFLVL